MSFVAEVGERLDDRNDNNFVSGEEGLVITGSDIEIGAASALTDASNRIGQVLLDRYEKFVPVVEVLSGRKVYAIFSKTTEISIFDDYADGEFIPISLD